MTDFLTGVAIIAGVTVVVTFFAVGLFSIIEWLLTRPEGRRPLIEQDLSGLLQDRLDELDYRPGSKLDPVEFAQLEDLIHNLAKDDPDWARKHFM